MHVKNYESEMLPLETNQSGGKLLPYSDLRGGGGVLEEVSHSRKRPLGRPRRSWEDNIEMDLQEVGGGRGDWMELAQARHRWRAIVGNLPDHHFKLSAPTLLSLVGDPLSGNKRVWFTESHIIYVISLLLVALLSHFILNNLTQAS
jgi:hypothetical protein